MTSPHPQWWLVLVVALAGAGVGLLLARRLETLDYRLDDEQGPAPAHPVVVAAAVPLVWALMAWQVGGLERGAVLPAYLLVGLVGVALVWIDVDVHRLPEGLTLWSVPAILLLLGIASASSGDWWALLRAVGAGAAVWLVYVVLALIRPGGLGLGDATLGGVAALPLGYVGWVLAAQGLFLSTLLSGVGTLVLLILRRVTLKGSVAYGPFIVLGLLATIVLGFHHPGG
ncbi:MAG: prepilin peptidase [Actinomycetota bacterium]|nr:prepilin peptidase [Actinomycetota bacterium]